MDVYVVYEEENHIKPPIGVYGSLEKARAQAHEAAGDIVRSLGASIIQDGWIGDDQNSIVYGNSQRRRLRTYCILRFALDAPIKVAINPFGQ
jgi:hypothetical protein